MADMEAVCASEAALREELSVVKAQVRAHLGGRAARCGGANRAARLCQSPAALYLLVRQAHFECLLQADAAAINAELAARVRVIVRQACIYLQTRQRVLTVVVQAMEERCTALAEDQEKLAATNQRLSEENKRLQEVRAGCERMQGNTCSCRRCERTPGNTYGSRMAPAVQEVGHAKAEANKLQTAVFEKDASLQRAGAEVCCCAGRAHNQHEAKAQSAEFGVGCFVSSSSRRA